MDTPNTNGTTNGSGARPMIAEQFAGYIEKRLALNDDVIAVLGRAGMDLRLRVRGRDVAINLTQFYAAYANNPEQLDAIAQTFVRVLTQELPQETPRTYAELADRIFPMLKPIALLATVRERKLPMLLYREFLADLMITYVIDEQRSVSFINEDHIERWEVSAQDLHERAIENLRQRTLGKVDYMATGEGEQRLFIFNSADGYDATRLLMAEVLEGWAKAIPGQLVIGVPNRDFLVAFSDADGDILRNIAHQVQADAAQHAHGLTDQLFTFQDGRVLEYDWE